MAPLPALPRGRRIAVTVRTASPHREPDAEPASSRHGVTLTFETLRGFEGDAAPLRHRPSAETLLRVVDGLVRVVLEGEEILLGPGDEARIPAGAAHRISSAGGQARIVSASRPAPAR